MMKKDTYIVSMIFNPPNASCSIFVMLLLLSVLINKRQTVCISQGSKETSNSIHAYSSSGKPFTNQRAIPKDNIGL